MELLARRVHRSARSAGARFLAEHFASFIREEVEPMTPWTGFTRNFGRDWQHYEEFSAQIRALLKLASDEMAQAIKQIGPGLSARTSGITQNQDYFEKAWVLWERRKSRLSLYVGVYNNEDDAERQILDVEFRWDGRTDERLRHRRNWPAIANRFGRSRNAILYDDDGSWETWLQLDEAFLALSRTKQEARVRRFVRNTLVAFASSGMVPAITG
jgi:hypothetical protein